MPGQPLSAIFFVAACALSTASVAQNAYKCADGYSQTPCPGGVAVNADTRSAEQKAQADLATSRDARMATAMEKARIEQERRDLAANTPPKPAQASAASKPRTPWVKTKTRKKATLGTDKSKGAKKTSAKKPRAKGKPSTTPHVQNIPG